MDTDVETDEALAGRLAKRDESAAARSRTQDAFRDLYDRHARQLLAFLSGG